MIDYLDKSSYNIITNSVDTHYSFSMGLRNTSGVTMDTTDHAEQSHSPGSINLLYALNSVATSIQKSISSEEHVFTIFNEQVIGLGLRGGISELDDERQKLVFKTVAFTNPIRKFLSRYEKRLKLSSQGYSIDPRRVDVYRKVVLEGTAVFVPDTSSVSSQVVSAGLQKIVKPLLSFLGSPPGIFAPLIYNGEIRGMLNIVGPHLTEADIPTMQAFANQIAVALENARLMNQLTNANQALETAYQKTLEGWVQALDLRDNETEGHTLRVSLETVKLSRHMGINEAELKPIYQGALLHDIGKMAIPDHILLKPGPLSTDEWMVMRQHPVLAYRWLKSIEYLRDAVVIPYCHHERWDGQGYPQGLKGDEIPYWARIFAVIDVWDAMRSDRPYRQGLSQAETLDYICDQSGRHFDPSVVNAFLDYLHEGEEIEHREPSALS